MTDQIGSNALPGSPDRAELEPAAALLDNPPPVTAKEAPSVDVSWVRMDLLRHGGRERDQEITR